MKTNESRGLALGTLGMLIFSLTLPMTHIVVAEMNPFLNGLGRAEVAAVLAAAVLWFRRAPLPTRRQFGTLVVAALGVVVGFPVLSAVAMHFVPSAHGAMINGLMPFAVAAYAYLFGGERPSAGFWACAAAGSAIVLFYALADGGGALAAGDLLMVGAVVVGGLGYAAGGKLAREMGGWQVICWSLVIAAPVLAFPTGWLLMHHWHPLSKGAWLAFAYVAVGSQFLGFFAWYAGLGIGGVARVGQVQLLQAFVTIGLSALLFGERIPPIAWPCALAVAVTVLLGKRMVIHIRPAQRTS
ncbi:multidrug DMT transporter permease [Burkholderia lata]|uniref:Multidrug DMT transporter permease n=1 Tax=Burkholderia lata (strain ATCC 17760 / DSM 23089 / LMG 22485 / NCIMB 9086 / R18194 / 383) TaxID=482957 RepID=A0A6P2X8S1_BURL3|nr:DMT family transporter [Burkholderia lata]VWD05812.1 multidrug DMT transporter permease [Burkholderia lata]